MDQRTRKLMTMHKTVHPRDDVDRLYISRKEGGRGLASSEDSVDASIKWLEDYIEKHEGGLITAIKNNTDNTMTNRMTITRKQKWEEKQLYELFKWLINNITAKKDAIRTYHIKERIDKKQQNSKCRLCGDRDKTINHIITECRKLAQKEYKTRHDWVVTWSTRRCARNLSLTMRTNGICTTQHLSRRNTRTNSNWNLTYKRIP